MYSSAQLLLVESASGSSRPNRTQRMLSVSEVKPITPRLGKSVCCFFFSKLALQHCKQSIPTSVLQFYGNFVMPSPESATPISFLFQPCWTFHNTFRPFGKYPSPLPKARYGPSSSATVQIKVLTGQNLAGVS